MSIKVNVTGVGGSTDVVVDAEATVLDALNAAGIDAKAQGLNVKQDGESIEDPAEARVEDGSSVTATPRAAKLG